MGVEERAEQKEEVGVERVAPHIRRRVYLRFR